MEQKKTHIWGGPYNNTSPEIQYVFCDHCGCKKKFEYGYWSYMPVGKSDWQVREPDCITSKKSENGNGSAT